MKKIILLSIFIVGILNSQGANAQSFFNWLKKDKIKETVQNIAGEVASDYVNFSIVGDWTYDGAAIKLESGNAVKDIASSAIASSIEDKITNQLEKLGIKAGMMHFKFNEDQTMLISLGSRKINGTYTYDKETKVLAMKIARTIPIKSTVQVTNSKFSLLFNANGLVAIAKTVSGKLKISSLESACKLLDEYKEMRMGFGFKK